MSSKKAHFIRVPLYLLGLLSFNRFSFPKKKTFQTEELGKEGGLNCRWSGRRTTLGQFPDVSTLKIILLTALSQGNVAERRKVVNIYFVPSLSPSPIHSIQMARMDSLASHKKQHQSLSEHVFYASESRKLTKQSKNDDDHQMEGASGRS